VLYALAANAAVAVVKGAAGVVTGSSALLAEAAHSVADTANQGLLLVSLSLGERPPDEEHPFGHGKERFFWTLLAAVVVFVAGAVFAVGEGVLRLLRPLMESVPYSIVYGTIAFAFVAEGISWVRAIRQTRDELRASGVSPAAYLRHGKDPTLKLVVSEDTAAVVGLVIALAGTVLAQVTGNRAFDAAAAILVGLLLIGIAIAIGSDAKGLLIGEASPPEERETLRRTIAARPEIDDVVDLLTMYIGPTSLLVAARVDLADGLTSEQVEAASDELDRELRAVVAAVDQVFLDPTRSKG
jgi:cation diffusion facilitator family transporter